MHVWSSQPGVEAHWRLRPDYRALPLPPSPCHHITVGLFRTDILTYCIASTYQGKKKKALRQKATSAIWRDRTNLRTRHDNNVELSGWKFKTTMHKMLRALMDKVVVQSLSCVWLSLWPHGLQYIRLPSPSLSPRVCSNSCLLSWWCHPTISFSFAHFSCPQIFPATGPFPVNWLLASGDQNIGTLSKVLAKLDNMQKQRINVSRKWKS